MKKKIALLLFLFFPLFLYSASFTGKPEVIFLENGEKVKEIDEMISSYNFSKTISKTEERNYSKIDLYLYTGGPGSIVWENFGHSGIIMVQENGRVIMFDFGIFSFDESFFINFALGKLFYLGLSTDAVFRIDELEGDDRTSSFVKLNLTPLEKKNLISFLIYLTTPGNNIYLYDYYFDNCATRLRDAYNEITNGDFKTWAESINTGETLRDISLRYLSRSTFFVDWAINYLLGPTVDIKTTLYEASFVPDILENAICEYENSPILTRYESMSRKITPSYYPFTLYSFLFSLVVFLFVLLSHSKHHALSAFFDFILFILDFVLFVLSSVLLFLMTSSIHTVTYYNFNVLILSPLIIVLSICHLIAIFNPKKRKLLSTLSAILLLFTLSLLCFKGIFITELKQNNFSYYLFAISLYTAEALPFFKRKKTNE